MQNTENLAEDGYRLWLRYELVSDVERLAEYRSELTCVVMQTSTSTWRVAREELEQGLAGLRGEPICLAKEPTPRGAIVAGTPGTSRFVAELDLTPELDPLGAEGFVVRRVKTADGNLTVIAANTDIGVLYGVFAFLRHLQAHRPLSDLDLREAPKLRLRMLNHWDNLDRTVERGYAGLSLWEWSKLPDQLSPRYRDYARANASIGINGVALTNVNADARALTGEYLPKIAALASVFRPYGIRVYLTTRFSAPIEIGGLTTADPLVADVKSWWRSKCQEIYRLIPDFGGFLVKANSEGQPGPQDYGRTHADGANLLADAIREVGEGLVLWRAFVYRQDVVTDRARQAFDGLAPLDGRFQNNVIVQIKNGPIDFQPREPFHPLFGGMPKTPLLVEFQITQEYLGQGTHLAYLGPLFKETLESDTRPPGPRSLVSEIVTGMAGVTNIGTVRNWCGHPFGQANWFAFGRLAWDHRLGSDEIADDWLRLTFTNDARFVAPAKSMMLMSREAVVKYMTPLGLHHLMAEGHHHGPGPWVDTGRPDWTSVYYHRADDVGIGFDRSATGSNAVGHYHVPWSKIFGSIELCPEPLLLWFHHVPWTYQMRSGRTLWDELCLAYQTGVASVQLMQSIWDSVDGFIDRTRFAHVKALLEIQEREARWWRDACVLYFQTFSKLPIPAGCEPAPQSLEFYRRQGGPGIESSALLHREP